MSDIIKLIKTELSKGKNLKYFDVDLNGINETIVQYDAITHWSMKASTSPANPSSHAIKSNSAISSAKNYAESVIASPSAELLNSALGVIDKADLSNKNIADTIQLNLTNLTNVYSEKKPCKNCNSTGSCTCSACGGQRKSHCSYVTCNYGKVTCASCSGSGKSGGYSGASPSRCNHCSGQGHDNCKKCRGTGYSICSACTDGTRRCGACKGQGSIDRYYSANVSCVKAPEYKVELIQKIDDSLLSELIHFKVFNPNNGYSDYINSNASANQDGKTFSKSLRYEITRKSVDFNINGSKGRAVVCGNKLLRFDRDPEEILPFTLDSRHIEGETKAIFLGRLQRERRIKEEKEKAERGRLAQIREVLYDPIQITMSSLVLKSLTLFALLLTGVAVLDFYMAGKFNYSIMGVSSLGHGDLAISKWGIVEVVVSMVIGVPIAIAAIFLTRQDKKMLPRLLLVYSQSILFATVLLSNLPAILNYAKYSEKANLITNNTLEPFDLLFCYIDALAVAPYLIFMALFIVIARHRRAAYMQVVKVAKENGFLDVLEFLKKN